MDQKKILISAGGTGGHLYPAQGLADELLDLHSGWHIMFAAGGLSTNKFFNRETYDYKDITTATFGKSIFDTFRSFKNIFKGFMQSRKLLKEFKPDLVIGFGSFYTFPTLLAAKTLKIPIILHEANSIPGKVNRYLSPYAAVTAIHFPGSASFLKGNIVQVGMPIRKGYEFNPSLRQEALSYFNLKSGCPTLLVFGGSQGAKAINNLATEALTSILHQQLKSLQIIHLTGGSEATDYVQVAYAKQGIHACIRDFETRMDLAWSIADFALVRAGASSIAEQVEYEVPGILIPYPFATDDHQSLNAQYFVTEVQGGVVYKESDSNAKKLAIEILSFLDENQSKIKLLKANIAEFKKDRKNENFCHLVLSTLGQLEDNE